jgi:hypothetical protein
MLQVPLTEAIADKCKENGELTSAQMVSTEGAFDLVPDDYHFERTCVLQFQIKTKIIMKGIDDNSGMDPRRVLLPAEFFQLRADFATDTSTLSEPSFESIEVSLRGATSWDGSRMLYSLWLDGREVEGWDEKYADAATAYRKLQARHGVQTNKRAHLLFGFQCTMLQDVLCKRHTHAITKLVVPQSRALAPRQSFKVTALNIASQADLDCKGEAKMFGYKSVIAAVEAMISSLEKVLIVVRQPEARAQAVIQTFLEHPDVKKVISSLNVYHWGWSIKGQKSVDGILSRLKEAIAIHKLQRNSESLLIYQILMNISAPPRGSGLMRETARLLELSSRKGLTAGSTRVALQRVDEEGDGGCYGGYHTSFYVPGTRKTYSNSIDVALLAAALTFWIQNTRVTANRNNVVKVKPLPPAVMYYHPVHWLEDTVQNFYLHFLESGRHFYPNQLRVRGVSKDVNELHIRGAFSQWKPAKVQRHAKYFYVTFGTPSATRTALQASSDPTFRITGEKVEVGARPLIGFTKFCEERPCYVKRVGAASCVCERCYGMKLLFVGLLSFPHWDAICPAIAELIAAARARAGAFSPNVDNILDVLLCDRAEDGYFRDECCQGTCGKESCGFAHFFGGLDVADTTVTHEEEKVQCNKPVALAHDQHGFYSGRLMLPIPAPLLAGRGAILPDTEFAVIDLGMRLSGNPSVPSTQFGAVVPAELLGGEHICATLCLLHEFIRLELITLDSVASALAGEDQSEVLRDLISSKAPRLITDVFSELLEVFQLYVVLHMFQYQKSDFSLMYAGSTGSVDVDDSGMAYADLLPCIFLLQITGVSGGHFVVAVPQAANEPVHKNAKVEEAPEGAPRKVFVSFDAYESLEKVSAEQEEDPEAHAIKKKRPTLSHQKLPPSEFVSLFASALPDYANHRFIAVHQTHEEQALKQKLITLPDDFTPIVVDMDFSENHEIVHKVEIQSEHWGHQQVTLYIVITHYRTKQADGAWTSVSEAHVFVSSDLQHDTDFVQHAMLALQAHFRRRGMIFKQWFFNTDGAASHFKQRFTFQSVHSFKTASGATSVVWEVCAPGHGKVGTLSLVPCLSILILSRVCRGHGTELAPSSKRCCACWKRIRKFMPKVHARCMMRLLPTTRNGPHRSRGVSNSALSFSITCPAMAKRSSQVG